MLARKNGPRYLQMENGPRYLQMETFISDLFRHECYQDNYYVLDKKLQMFYPTTHSNELLFIPRKLRCPHLGRNLRFPHLGRNLRFPHVGIGSY
nr:Glycoprotein 105 [Human betaherpesvirus 6A]AVI07782.1 Glycoprotein 105 [Human betaherpesvirus 6A]AVI07904.1 Glycoprotein 105 [Human betaherpesvirus 6A]AVI08285.1 Glycoprotein 105 [Human betaherpesvirus 6A]AVI08530.1 Glycoprotein 105 [Human betaherpesvirus 6A]